MNESKLNPKQELNLCMDDDTKVAIATTVYIIKDEKVLLMKQTKPHSVVDKYYVGIGGKTPIRTYLSKDKEKVGYDAMISSMLSGKFEIQESMEDLAIREVNEEVGLSLIKDKLQDIGITEVRLLNQKVNELWYIKNYIYYANGTEGKIRECDEGTLEFVPIGEVRTKPMLPHDRIIFGEKNPTTYIQSMNDDIHNLKQLRICQKRQGKGIYILLPDLQANPHDIKGIITEETSDIPKEYRMLTKSIPEEKLRAYLKSLGILERTVGTISKDNLPIDIEQYIL